MKRNLLFTVAVIMAMTSVTAQSLKRAQKSMDLFNYTKAIQLLNRKADKEKYQQEAIPMLAESYRLKRDFENAKNWYAKAIELPNASPEWTYKYAQILRTLGDYTTAKQYFLKYAQIMPSDSRGKFFAASCDSVLNIWKNKPALYDIKLVSNICTPQSDFGAAIYNGELVFASDRYSSLLDEGTYGWTGNSYLDIFSSKPVENRNFYGDMGRPVSFGRHFNQTFHDGPATFSADGNVAYFTRAYHDKAAKKDRIRTYELKIFTTTKKDGEWSKLEPFFLNSPDYSVGQPALSPDQQTLYFISDMPGGVGGTDIWMCKKEGDGWGTPVNMGSTINTPGDEMFPFVREDGVLLFASDGHAGFGGLDIFSSSYNNSKWTTPVNLGLPMNSSYDDFAMAQVAGTKEGFFSSNRPGGIGSDDIYAFRMKEILPEAPKPQPYTVQGYVKDKKTLQPIAGATVFMLNPLTEMVYVMKTDASGLYKTTLEGLSDFSFKAMSQGYIADCLKWPIDKLVPGATLTAPRDLLLEKLVIQQSYSINNIYYDFDKWDIRPDAEPELNKLVNLMKEQNITVELGSHTDCRGSFKYNDKLSQKRAESAVNYITRQGINSSRLTAKGYGEYQLTNKCSDGVACTEEEHQANRRTEFKVLSIEEPKVNTDIFNPAYYTAGESLDKKSLPDKFFQLCK